MIYPLTLGLLASMAIRYDHGFGICMTPWETHDKFLKRQRECLDTVLAYYKLYCTNSKEAVDPQLNEEITGKGFYYPCHEKEYISYIRCDVTGLL